MIVKYLVIRPLIRNPAKYSMSLKVQYCSIKISQLELDEHFDYKNKKHQLTKITFFGWKVLILVSLLRIFLKKGTHVLKTISFKYYEFLFLKNFP